MTELHVNFGLNLSALFSAVIGFGLGWYWRGTRRPNV